MTALAAICLALASASSAQTTATVSLVGPKIALIVAANGFRDEEFEIPYKLFASSASVSVASTKLGELRGMMGLKPKADTLVSDIKVDKLDGLVLVGGPGARQYWDNATVHKLVREAVGQEKVLAAICIAPVTLANAGVLKGKKATVWISMQGKLTSAGAKYTDKPVEVDGLIVTGNGPEAAQKFAETVLALILKQHKKRQEALKAAALKKPGDAGKPTGEPTKKNETGPKKAQ